MRAAGASWAAPGREYGKLALPGPRRRGAVVLHIDPPTPSNYTGLPRERSPTQVGFLRPRFRVLWTLQDCVVQGTILMHELHCNGMSVFILCPVRERVAHV